MYINKDFRALYKYLRVYLYLQFPLYCRSENFTWLSAKLAVIANKIVASQFPQKSKLYITGTVLVFNKFNAELFLTHTHIRKC